MFYTSGNSQLRNKKLSLLQIEEARRYKNVDHMMVNYEIATIRESMFCAWPQIRMEKLILQLIKKKNEQPWQVTPIELPQNIKFTPFCHPTKVSAIFLSIESSTQTWIQTKTK